MNTELNIKAIEEKWQKKWEKLGLHSSDKKNTKNKKYCLTMFSYPSGDKLHVGHWYNYGPVDTFARFLKMNGYNVFQPQGFDSFGLPAENYAIKHGIHPKKSTHDNIAKMKSQLKKIGGMFDWSSEVQTSNEDYYRWTQWLFIQLYNKNLAYQKEALVNWDPVDQTVLANEQVLSDGTSERSGGVVIQKPLKQWFFKITEYAEELLSFKDINWPKKTMLMQKNWIGKSVGAEINFKLIGSNNNISIYTTRPDTIFGCTYMVISPEHPIVQDLNSNPEIAEYCNNASKKNELQRTDLEKDKSGVFTGLYAENPLNGNHIPIWIADYVLMGYGTGAIMAVPGHDQRDFEFAKKYNLDIVKVVDDGNDVVIEEMAFCGEGISVNSDFLNELTTDNAKKKIITWLEKNNIGKSSVKYKLKDWLISRQRYWGAPIPIVYSPDGKAHVIPEEHLPWLLPNDVEYKPKGTSPLGSSKELLERTEKIFGKGWRPEIDTMDTFVCSSWYYLRYPDSTNNNNPFTDASNKWLPVDYYIGGSEHATMHLLYARFITKCLRDLNYVKIDEPFTNLFHQGVITKDGSKMSKSKGNTVSPDDFVDSYGSDVFRCYLMFMGPFDEGGDWNDKGITGIDRFIRRAWRLAQDIKEYEKNDEDQFIIHDTIKVVTENLDSMRFNTSISKLMEFVNHFIKKGINLKDSEIFIKLLGPFAPHVSEELWEMKGNKSSLFDQSWPSFDKSKLEKNKIVIAVQVNGKLRGNVEINPNDDKEKILTCARDHENVKLYLENSTIVKEIYVPNKIINFVIKG